MIDQEHIDYEFFALFYSCFKIKNTTNFVEYNIHNIAGYNAAYNLLEYMENNVKDIEFPPYIVSLRQAIYIQIRSLTEKRIRSISAKLQTKDMFELLKFIYGWRYTLNLFNKFMINNQSVDDFIQELE